MLNANQVLEELKQHNLQLQKEELERELMILDERIRAAFENAKRQRRDTVSVHTYELTVSAKKELELAGWKVVDCKGSTGGWLIIAQP